MTIVELREMRDRLTERMAGIAQAVMTMNSVSATFTSKMAESYCQQLNDCSEFDREELNEEISKLIGTTMPIFGAYFFESMIDYGGRNICYHVREIQKLAQVQYPIINAWGPRMAEPSIIGWSMEEISMIRRTYQRQITLVTHKIRDINTHWKYLTNTGHQLPSFIKPVVLGMFGGADHLTDFVYTDADFKYQEYQKRSKVMTARWLAPFIGKESAYLIEALLKTIGETSAPLKGEPETLNGFSSHTTNKIKLFTEDDSNE